MGEMSKERTKEILREVRRIEIKARRISDQYFTGEYQSAFRGSGLSFAEVRPYQYGDEVRSIDWNVTARTGEPYIKVFEEERESSVLLVFDNSASMFFGSGDKDKRLFAVEMAATIAYSAIAVNDKVGLLIFDANGHKLVPPARGRSQLFRLVSALVEAGQPVPGRTPLAEVLKNLMNMRIQSNVCFIISDFQTDDYRKPVKSMALKYDLTGMYIEDPAEVFFPVFGRFFARDLETGREFILNRTSGVEPGAVNVEDSYSRHAAVFRSSGAELLRFNTQQSFVPVLMEFFKRRVS
jgi:uncharacterized protein (DUF58 family)